MAFLFRTSSAIEGHFDQHKVSNAFSDWAKEALGLSTEVISGASHGIWWTTAEISVPHRRRIEFGGGQHEGDQWFWLTVELPDLAVIERPRLEPTPTFIEALPTLLAPKEAIFNLPIFCETPTQVERLFRESRAADKPTVFLYGGRAGEQLSRSQAMVVTYVRGLARVVIVPEYLPPPLLNSPEARSREILPGSVITVSRFRTRVLPSRALQRQLPPAGRLLQQQISEIGGFSLPAELQRSRRRAFIEQARTSFGENEWIELVDEQERKISELEVRSISLQETLDAVMLEVLDYESELKLTAKRVRQLAWLIENPRSIIEEVEDDLVEFEPLSCVEAIEAAGSFLENLTITASLEAAEQLDSHQLSSQWARMGWKLLLGLDDYAKSKRNGFQGNLYAYASNPPSGARPLYPERVALAESESTASNRLLRASRTFQVPSNVDQSGFAYMPAHLKVGSGGHYPRIHFLDDTQGKSGTVVVGYFGKHLPTSGD